MSWQRDPCKPLPASCEDEFKRKAAVVNKTASLADEFCRRVNKAHNSKPGYGNFTALLADVWHFVKENKDHITDVLREYEGKK